MSIDELMAASSFSDGLAADGADRPHSKELTGITQSLHREFDNISKMMEESMNVQQDASKNGFQQREKGL